MQHCAKPKENSRSLLSGETLVDDLGVGVDAQVVNGRGVGRSGRAVRATGHLAQGRRAQNRSRSSLHGGAERRSTRERVNHRYKEKGRGGRGRKRKRRSLKLEESRGCESFAMRISGRFFQCDQSQFG